MIHKLLNKLKKLLTPTDIRWKKELKYVESLMKKHFGYSWTISIPRYSDLCRELKIKYIHDRIFKIIPWDYQFNSEQVVKRGGADCNSLHRILQCIGHLKGYEAYLCHMFWSPFKGHTTCVLKKGESYTVLDYDTMLAGNNLKELLDETLYLYGKKLKFYYMETIDWKIRD